MKKISFIGFFIFSLFFALSCKKSNTNVAGNLTTAPAHSPQETPAGPLHVYGNYFQVQNSGIYKKLLEILPKMRDEAIYHGALGGDNLSKDFTLSAVIPSVVITGQVKATYKSYLKRKNYPQKPQWLFCQSTQGQDTF